GGRVVRSVLRTVRIDVILHVGEVALAAAPDHEVEDRAVGVVTRLWSVLIPILDVLHIRARAQLGRYLRTAVHAEIEALERVGRINRLHVQIGRADADVRARASSGDRDVGRGGAAGIEEVRDVVRRRHPGLGYSVAPPLNDRPAVHLGTPAAVDVVADSAALAILVGEIATG